MGSVKGYSRVDFENHNVNIVAEYSESSLSNSSKDLYSSGNSIEITIDPVQHEDFKTVVRIDLLEDDQPVSMKRINWADLPSLAVENIYSFLSRADQSRMSLVCSRWAKEFNSPGLWKTMKFYLHKQDYSSKIYPEVRFARKYASMFRHVEIISETVKPRLIDVIWSQLKLFLQTMAFSSQLTTIKFIRIGDFLYYLNDILYQDLFQTITSFFNSQDNLKTVVFQDSHFSNEEGLELLKAILHSNRNTIRNLTIRGFVDNSTSMTLSHQYMSNVTEVSGKIGYVQSLEVDYTEIFKDVISCLCEKLSLGDFQLVKKTSCMSNIYIYCEDNGQSVYGRIPPGTWKYLTKVFPQLLVKMSITVHSDILREMENFLIRGIPLQTLDFRYEKLSAPLHVDAIVFATHLCTCNYQNYLEVINILWMPFIPDFSDIIILFIQSCKKLRRLCLHINSTPRGIERILRVLLKSYPTTLQSVTIFLNYIQDNEVNGLIKHLNIIIRRSLEEYYQLFKIQGIDLFLVAEPCRRLQWL